MANYELTCLVSRGLKSEKNKVKEQILSQVQEVGGEVVQEDTEEISLEYPVKNETEVFSHVIFIRLPETHVSDLRKKLQSNHSLLRFLILKKKRLKPKEPPSTKTIKGTKGQERIKEKETVIRKSTRAPKTKLKDLDKKIDEILGEEVV